MSRPDEFALITKEKLAKRVGYRCSFLECGAPTFGPSDENESAISNSGMACHISAASSGKSARRYDSLMSSEKRRAIENGIWMCYVHGKIIDNDETRFSIEILKRWKEIAEGVARLMAEQNVEYKEALKIYTRSDITANSFVIEGTGKENLLVGEALFDSCITISWGHELTNILREFLIEYIRNAFQHGKANEVKFETKKNEIVIIDDGANFNPKILIGQQNISGGILSINQLIEKLNSNIVLFHQRIEHKNIITIGLIRSIDEISSLIPCSHTIAFDEYINSRIEIKIEETCNELYIVLPHFFALSDIRFMTRTRLSLNSDSRPITYITSKLSPWAVKLLKETNPDCHVITID